MKWRYDSENRWIVEDKEDGDIIAEFTREGVPAEDVLKEMVALGKDERSRMGGCKDCMHMFKDIEGIQCGIRPHEFATLTQRRIVDWLTKVNAAGDDPWHVDGCPSWAGRKNRMYYNGEYLGDVKSVSTKEEVLEEVVALGKEDKDE